MEFLPCCLQYLVGADTTSITSGLSEEQESCRRAVGHDEGAGLVQEHQLYVSMEH